jgi:rhodanese-related sulfurtransferase
MTIKTVHQEVIEVNDETDYVLLDIRDHDEYSEFHIKDAESFPAPMINRNAFKPHIYNFKNKPNCLIIV